MPAIQRDLLEARRRLVLARAILWGNAHYDDSAGLALSGDRRGHTINNVQYAVALAEAAAENLEVGFPGDQARARAFAILTLVLGDVRSERSIPRYHGPGAPDLPVRIACDRVLWPLAYLLDHREGLGVPSGVAESIDPVVSALLQAQQQGEARRRRRRAEPPAAASVDGPPVWDTLRQAVGMDVHWSAITASAAVQGGGSRPWPLPRPVPWPWPDHLGSCPDSPMQRCETRSCRLPCLDFDTGHISQCPTWADACSVPHVDVEFFKGDRGLVTPVVFVGGWEPQYVPGSGGLGFGPNTRFSTLPPAWQHGGSGPHPFPPVMVFDVARNDLRNFYGLSTMLRCAAGYDHVRWAQSDPGGPIQTAVNELAAVIKQTKAVYGVSKVILVCHSRGGLVARKYIVNQWKLCGEVDVEEIITLGSPHLGAELAYLAADTLMEILSGDTLQQLTDALISGLPGSPLVAVLDVIGAIDPALKEQAEEQLALLAAPLLDLVWPGYEEFVLSGEEMRPDSAFITELNDDYSQPVVPVKGKQGDQLVSFWDAIPHVLVAGVAPDLWTAYLGCWLPELSLQGIWEALQPQTCWTSVGVDGVSINVPYFCWYWKATWFPIFRCLGTLAPFITDLAQLDTFREGLGDAVVARYSALAEGVTGAIRRAEYKLEHFALPDNSEQQAVFDSPAGTFSMNIWQLLFYELGITDTSTTSTKCTSSECDGFTFQNAF